MHNVFHVSLLRAFKTNDITQVPVVTVDTTGQGYQVHKVLAHRFVGRLPAHGRRKARYLVSYENKGVEHNTWLPSRRLAAFGKEISEYWESRPQYERDQLQPDSQESPKALMRKQLRQERAEQTAELAGRQIVIAQCLLGPMLALSCI